MKKKNLLAMAMMGLALFCSSCSDDDTSDDGNNGAVVSEKAMDVVIANYVDKVVLPTYEDMENKVSLLNTAVDKYITSGTQEDLDAACSAWRAARKPWEQSEAFLYGPADYENLDPSLDSWPLQKDDIDQILASQDFSQIEGDNTKAQGVRGYHTLEYLLFENGKSKKTENVTANEKGYMKRVSARLLEDAEDLHKAWVSGLGNENIPTSFGDEMKNHTSSRTASAKRILGEFIIDGGINNISDEVGGQKIGNPYDYWKSGDYDQAVLEVESWYSWNSLTDYEDNIISIENSYMGGRRGDRDEDKSFSALVKSVNPELDSKVQKKIAATIEAIRSIPAPFRNNLDAKTEIEAAQAACTELTRVFEEVKTALELN